MLAVQKQISGPILRSHFEVHQGYAKTDSVLLDLQLNANIILLNVSKSRNFVLGVKNIGLFFLEAITVLQIVIIMNLESGFKKRQ
jgi:hypothetical protein